MILKYIADHISWSEATFGDRGNMEYLLRHIEKEIAEVKVHPDNLEEWIDIMILAIEGLWKTGLTAEEITEEFFRPGHGSCYSSRETLFELISLQCALLRQNLKENQRCWLNLLTLAFSGALSVCHCRGAIMAELQRKQSVNMSRTWIMPEDPEAPIEHERRRPT